MLSLRTLVSRSSRAALVASQRLNSCQQLAALSAHPLALVTSSNSLSSRRNCSSSDSSKLADALHATQAVSAVQESKLSVDQILNHVSIMEQWTCSGCGIELQYKEPKQVGFFPKQLLNNIHDLKDLKRLRCERCFQMTQYGKISDTKMPYQEYEKRVMELRSKDMLMIQLVDILDISGSLLPKARHVFGNKPVMLVVNKGDLVPTKSGIRRLMRRIKQEAKEAGIDNLISIYLISAMKRIGMKEIVEDVAKYRQGRDICVVGAANVGKSTFLNSFLSHLVDRKWQHNHRKYMKMSEVQLSDLDNDETATMLNIDDELLAEAKAEREKAEGESTVATPYGELYVAPGEDPEMIETSSEEDREMTTSPLPGTTLAVQYLPVMVRNEVFNILDTPGLITDSKRQKLVEVLALDGAAKLKNVFPTKQLPVTTYRVRPGRSLFLGALARFDYETLGNDTDKNLLLLSWYGVLPGHLTKTERAEDTFVKHAGGILSPPRGLDAMSFTGPLNLSQNVYLKDYVLDSVLTKSKHKTPKRTTIVELEVPGFGWLSVTAVDLDGTAASQKTLKHGKSPFTRAEVCPLCRVLHSSRTSCRTRKVRLGSVRNSSS
eukprot:jgi/Phyca11/531569/estExt2_fgenesh1_pg.C_PHYCAscaffold_10193